ncbi:hypothetical protein J6590_017954 [Homalodisca vitripennis]|nr:hypothetical protein J6590_017954 [Homalodisca vitripennis]
MSPPTTNRRRGGGEGRIPQGSEPSSVNHTAPCRSGQRTTPWKGQRFVRRLVVDCEISFLKGLAAQRGKCCWSGETWGGVFDMW